MSMVVGSRHYGRSLTIVAVGLIAAVLTASAERATAQAPATAEAKLDGLLAAKDYMALGEELAAVPIDARLNWLKARLMSGASAFLVFPYVRDLWAAGEALKVDDPQKDMRVVAGLFMLYGYELIAIDGAKCEDVSAPVHRRDQLMQIYAPALKHLRAQPAEVRAQVVQLAIQLEQRTAPVRKDDDFLCRDGLAQMQHALGSGAKPQEDPSPQPGAIGKQMVIPAVPGYVPKFLPFEKYAPLQEKARADVQAAFAKLKE